jgi:hypothetical protein
MSATHPSCYYYGNEDPLSFRDYPVWQQIPGILAAEKNANFGNFGMVRIYEGTVFKILFLKTV